jgi:hypothetical protein
VIPQPLSSKETSGRTSSRFVGQPVKLSKIDQLTASDIYHVSEYCANIEKHMQTSEAETQPDPTYMQRQSSINENVRAILFDWLINVHLKFKLLTETLFITVNLIDRYLSIEVIKKEEI